MNIQSKIRGCFLGAAIGDALGKAVETMSAIQIKEKYGRITDYISNSDHKWFSEAQKGSTTDDWQLSKSVAVSLINAGKFDLDDMAEEHVKEFNISVKGWGGSTRESIARLAEGVHWSNSGKTDKPNRGTGNGICMKVAPLGLYMSLVNPECKQPIWDDHIEKIINLSAMTHRTSMAVTSGLAHVFATISCFKATPKNFDRKAFVRSIRGAAQIGNQIFSETLKDDLEDRFKMLEGYSGSNQDIINDFNGSCYVYDSLPFTYAFFLKNNSTIEGLYDCVSAGADADSNSSMMAALLGALHGEEFFPKHLVEGLQEKEEVLQIADDFYQKFGR